MKTTEQIKQEIVNYLIKTSNHIFIKPKATYKWSNDLNGHYVYDYNEFTYFKVFQKDGEFWVFENCNGQNTPTAYNIRKIDIDSKINYWRNNTKCVIGNELFLNKKMKSVKNSKKVFEEIEGHIK